LISVKQVQLSESEAYKHAMPKYLGIPGSYHVL